MYAKLIDSVFTFAPRHVVIGSEQVYNPTDAQLEALGYKPIVFTEPPEAPEGFYAEAGWTDNGETIAQTWTLAAIPGGETEA